MANEVCDRYRLRRQLPIKTSYPMHTHANSILTQRGRLRFVCQHLSDHRPLADLALAAPASDGSLPTQSAETRSIAAGLALVSSSQDLASESGISLRYTYK